MPDLRFDISDINAPQALTSIPIPSGAPNSVAVHNGKLAVALEASNKQMPGSIKAYDTESQIETASYGRALPDMVTFHPTDNTLYLPMKGNQMMITPLTWLAP